MSISQEIIDGIGIEQARLETLVNHVPAYGATWYALKTAISALAAAAIHAEQNDGYPQS